MQRKIITFTSIILMALTAFAGCSSLQKNYDPDNFLLNGTDDNPYRIVKNPVTIKKTKTKYKLLKYLSIISPKAKPIIAAGIEATINFKNNWQ